MGLDISAYSHLRPARTCDEKFKRFCSNSTFPLQCEKFIEGELTWDREISFRVGSYSYYGLFRAELCTLMLNMSIFELWKNPTPRLTRPFERLLNFSDCDGVFDTDTCTRLYHDFEQYQDRADECENHFAQTYEKFKEAFALGSQGGCVEFH